MMTNRLPADVVPRRHGVVVAKAFFRLVHEGHSVAAGHGPRLELLGTYTPCTRPSNGLLHSVAVSKPELRLRVHEPAGVAGIPAVVRAKDQPGG